MTRPAVSIIMRTKDVDDIVGQTLTALYSQTPGPDAGAALS